MANYCKSYDTYFSIPNNIDLTSKQKEVLWKYYGYDLEYSNGNNPYIFENFVNELNMVEMPEFYLEFSAGYEEGSYHIEFQGKWCVIESL